MKKFQGFKSSYSISGDETDAYYNQLPEHDLGALANFMIRLSKRRKIDLCLDIGANIGLSALIMSEISPAAEIIAFEPSPSTYSYLIKNISDNSGSHSIKPICSAVGNRTGKISFSDNKEASHGNHISDAGGVEVDLTTIDNFVSAQNLRTVDFIKIDVEGYETDVIAGASNTLLTDRPVVMFEYNEYALVNNARINPSDALRQIMLYLGVIAIVDPLTGETQMLPADPEKARATIAASRPGPFAVVDLVNRSV